MDAKRCADCGDVKEMDQFHRNATRPDGHHDRCKECRKKPSKPAATCSECGGRTYKGRPVCTHCAAPARKPRPPLQPCGTHAAYKRHLKAGEQACDLCLRAEADRAYRKLHPEWDGGERPRGRIGRPLGGGVGKRPFVCEKCGRGFERYGHVGNTITGVPRFCSRECFADFQRTGRSRVHARRRRAVVASTWDGVTDEQIWERDGWACMIPGCVLGPIRRDLKWPQRLSPTVDHIVPLSLGGTDIACNKRAAHAFCNMSRHNKVHPDDVQIITPELAPLGLLPRPERVEHVKVVHLCADCNAVQVRREGACCAGCRADARDARQQRVLAMHGRGMTWQKIADELGLSGPGAVYNIAYPPWDRYAG